MSDEIEVTCPSGMTGSFRGLIGKDYRSFNRQTARTGEGVTRILNACFTVQDPGVYKRTAAGGVDWADCLIGDHTYGLLAIRRAMYPNEPYVFRVNCKDSACRERFAWQLMLDDLIVKPLPDSTKAKMVEGIREFEIEIRGTKVTFQLLTGRDQVRRHKMIQKLVASSPNGDAPSEMVLALAARIVNVDGLDLGNGESLDYQEKVRWVEELETIDHMRMLAKFDQVDCGVETKIDVICSACGAQQEVELPLDENFLFVRS